MTHSITATDVRFAWPRMRQPIYFIVDDPAPCINLAYYEQYFERHTRDVPSSFMEQWADVIAEFGVRGKFTVLPVPAGIGRIDRPLPDVDPAEQAAFLRIARERVLPQMDICIEFLTHYLAWDIERERPTDFTEKTMGPFTNREKLTKYFAYGLRILQNVGLEPTGATSPGYSCIDIESAYQAAIRDAVREVTGRKVAWYFLHVDDRSAMTPPRIMSIDRVAETACVTVISAAHDPSWDTQFGMPSTLDPLLSPDGMSGRLADLYRNGGPIGFHTHWQSLFSNGCGQGLADFRITLGRIREHLGDGVLWMKCSDLADYTCAQASTKVTVQDSEAGCDIRLNAAFRANDFTVTLKTDAPVKELTIERRPLRRLPDTARTLEPETWRSSGGEIAWCSDLQAGETAVHLAKNAG